jgi:hypothetical protein
MHSLGRGSKAPRQREFFGWKVAVNGAIIIIGAATASFWLAFSAGRSCVGELGFNVVRKGGDSSIAAEASDPAHRIVGYVQAPSLKGAIGRLIA